VNVLAGVVYFNLWNNPYPNELGVAQYQAQAGDKAGARKTLDRAAELAATVTDQLGKSRALTAVAVAQARLGDFDAARKTAEQITRPEGKLIAWATVARTLAEAGKGKEALAVADRQPDAQAKLFVLIHAGSGQVKAGDRKGARESFRRAQTLLAELPDNERNGQTHNLASAQAEAGDYEAAVETAATLPEGSIALVNVAYTRAEAGDYAGALKMTGQMAASDWWQGNLYRGIAKVQTQRGREKAALEWVGRLDALARANALLGVAEGLVERKK
jgi:tetratricopeptide (TPR) repeat protein